MSPRQPSGSFVVSCPGCGWASKPARTEGLARHALGRHSCERTRRLADQAVRNAARYAHIDRTPVECHHPRADHQHGTRATYVFDKCRCLPCSAAAVEFERRRVKARAYGRPTTDLVDAAPVREYLLELLAAGMGRRRITALSGVNRNDINAIVRGGRGRPARQRIQPRTAAALLAVTLDPALGALIDPTGTTRRLRALVADGWTQTELAARLGATVTNFNSLILGRYLTVTRRTEARVRALYGELQVPPEPSPHALAAAHRHGWVPSACWDDDTIDDPFAHPNWTGFDEVIVRDWLAQCASPVGAGPEELIEVVRRLMAATFTATESAVLTGLSVRDVQVMRDHITRQDRADGVRRRVYKEAS